MKGRAQMGIRMGCLGHHSPWRPTAMLLQAPSRLWFQPRSRSYQECGCIASWRSEQFSRMPRETFM
jgi:hypothetical protein